MNPFVAKTPRQCDKCGEDSTVGLCVGNKFFCGSCCDADSVASLARAVVVSVDTTKTNDPLSALPKLSGRDISVMLVKRPEDKAWLRKSTAWHGDEHLETLIAESPYNESAATALSTLIACYASCYNDRAKAHRMANDMRLAGKRLYITFNKTEASKIGQSGKDLRAAKKASK